MPQHRTLLTLTLLLFPFLLNADEITIVADEWCPYNCAQNSSNPGYIVEIVKLVFARAGHNVIYITDSWNRTLEGVNNGKYAAAIAATPNELPNGIFPKETFGYSGNYFLVKKNLDWRYDSLTSLRNLRLGTIKGYDYGETLNQYFKQAPSVSRKTGIDAVKKNLSELYKGIIDVYVTDQSVAYHEAKQIGLGSQFKIAGSEGKPIALYLGFTPKSYNSKTYADILSQGIIDIRKEGLLAQILTKYGLKDWKK